jgi:hypothetical protein
MKPVIVMLLAILLASACQQRGSIVLRIVSIERRAIVLDIVNKTNDEIVVLSPEAPTRQVDDGRCALIISTKVVDGVRPYAFTPMLETVRAQSVRRFRAVLDPISLADSSCAGWSVDAEYAYVLRSDVAMFKGRAFEEFRLHVLKNQKLLTASVKETVTN